ncbi:MAG: hypothetical protein Aurels2KO_52310 [Aureliella sp.]
MSIRFNGRDIATREFTARDTWQGKDWRNQLRLLGDTTSDIGGSALEHFGSAAVSDLAVTPAKASGEMGIDHISASEGYLFSVDSLAAETQS